MLYSLRWLRDFTPVPDLPARTLRDDITTHIAEIDAITGGERAFSGVVAGKVLEMTQHPQADRLHCTVVTTDGTNRLRIVCGAPNVTEGQTVPVALPGARVLDRKSGESFVIEKTILRGEPSEGMLCAAEELGLPPREDGIMVLADDTRIGTPLEDVLGPVDVVIDIENKSLTNRPDLWSHRGMARELSVLYGTPLALPAPALPDAPTGVPVRIDAKTDARAYLAVTIEGVSPAPSPAWLSDRLESLGVRSVNTLVDATNLVMLETGQPLHAFDASRVSSLRIRLAKKGESMTSFDGSLFTLDPEDVVIVGPDGPLALAGVVGSPDSGVTASTTAIVLEAASFDPIRIRRTSARHAARTDAAVRFEKDLDPALTEHAAARCAELLAELHPAARVTGITRTVRAKRKPVKLRIRLSVVSAIIGDAIPRDEAIRILEGLGFEVAGRGDALTVTVPTFRGGRDVTLPEDLVEEIARFHGYNILPDTRPAMPLTTLDPADAARMRLTEDLRTRCALQLGATEVNTYPFLSTDELATFLHDASQHWRVLHPQSGEADRLRSSLLPGMVLAVEENLRRLPELQLDAFRLFEIGRVFHREPGTQPARPGTEAWLPHQPVRLALADVRARGAFAHLRGALDALLRSAGLPEARFLEGTTPASLHPGRAARVECAGRDVGVIGELHPSIRPRLGAQSFAYAEIDLEALAGILQDNPRVITAPPSHPSVSRDLSVIVSEERRVHELLNVVGAAEAPHLRDARAIEVFRGAPVPDGRKSVTLRITLRADDHTLTEREIDGAMAAIRQAVSDLGAEIR